jgi:hypothetical protein
MFGRGASEHGAVSVPGSKEVELPAGKVFLMVSVTAAARRCRSVRPC